MHPDDKIQVSIWRGDAGGGGFQRYAVPRQASQTVLDVVTWVQRYAAPDLSYRFACRVGMCGSCAMMVNDEPRWTCRSHVKDVLVGDDLRIAPLRNLPVIKDLVCDMTVFFDKWQKAEGRFHPTRGRDDDLEPILPGSRERRAADAGIECINCAVCYAACDVVSWDDAYLGPAALNRAWTLVNDLRDARQSHRWTAISRGGGCYSCHSQQGCASYCPVGLNPTLSIAGLKKAALKKPFG